MLTKVKTRLEPAPPPRACALDGYLRCSSALLSRVAPWHMNL